MTSATFKLVRTYEDKTDDLSGLAISGDGKKIARSTEKEITVWNESSGDSLTSFMASDQGAFHEIVFTLDNKSVIAASDNNTAELWNIVKAKSKVL